MKQDIGITTEQEHYIQERWLSYDCAMGDPWRNDFEEDGQSADENRYERMVDEVRHQYPELSEEQITRAFDRYR